MLLSFRVENHKSIREEQQLLLTPVYDDARPQEADWEASTVAGIFGANASGKSNILGALALMRDTVRWSMSDNEPDAGMRRYAFALDRECQDEPSTFVVDLVLDEVRHTYGFSVNDEQVTEEWLYRYPKQRKQVVFEREDSKFSFGRTSSKGLRQIEAITGRNVLFLTVAARARQDEVMSLYQWFSDLLSFAAERRPERPAWLRDGQASDVRVRFLTDLLASADTGIDSVELDEGADFSYIRHAIRSLDEESKSGSGGGEWLEELPDGEKIKVSEAWRRLVKSMGEEGAFSEVARQFRKQQTTLVFHHKAEDSARPLRWEEESLGTRAITALGFEAQHALEAGGVLVVDEIDASLHPYLSAKVISLFRDEEQNPKGAQLVFTSHDAALLGRVRGEEVLKRDHIWFVDKDDRGRTSLYPLSDFKPRGDDNRARRYLTGRYGAVPDVDDELFRDALHRRDREAEPEDASR